MSSRGPSWFLDRMTLVMLGVAVIVALWMVRKVRAEGFRRAVVARPFVALFVPASIDFAIFDAISHNLPTIAAVHPRHRVHPAGERHPLYPDRRLRVARPQLPRGVAGGKAAGALAAVGHVHGHRHEDRLHDHRDVDRLRRVPPAVDGRLQRRSCPR
jgi:hypothetical protein